MVFRMRKPHQWFEFLQNYEKEKAYYFFSFSNIEIKGTVILAVSANFRCLFRTHSRDATSGKKGGSALPFFEEKCSDSVYL